MLLLILLSKNPRMRLNKKTDTGKYPITIVFIPMKRQSLAYAANRSHIHGTDPV